MSKRSKAILQFIDLANLEVVAGDGGRGGDVVLKADPHLHTLLDYKYKRLVRAGRGGHGRGSDRRGKDGKDATLRVPAGTVVRDGSTGDLLHDLARAGDEVVVARGGKGGRGNAAFATPTDRAPRRFEEGRPGERRRIVLELKLIADVGLVGKPNVGKSTLLGRLTRARPKVAPYPFTTLTPNLGVLTLDDTVLVLADIPGLIEGAHAGKGLGHEFLRHIERTKVLVYMLDALSGDYGADLNALRKEIDLYNTALSGRRFMVVVNKVDLLSEEAIAALEREGLGMPVSARTGYGLGAFVERLAELVRSAAEEDDDGGGKTS